MNASNVPSQPTEGKPVPGVVGQKATTQRRPGQLVVVNLADVEEEHIDWLWEHRFPRGMLSLLAGFGDVGKSTVLYDMASRISTGAPWPNGEGMAPKGSVILFNREDPAKQIIKPRVMAAGGKVRKIHVVDGYMGADGKPRPFNMKDDLEELDALIKKIGDVRMVVFDPLSSYFDSKTNVWQEAQVRAVLEPLAQRAEKWGVAVIGNTHLGKGPKGNANLNILNSVGISNLARMIQMIVKDESDKELRIFGPTKKNITTPMPSLQFRFESVRVGKKQIEAPKIVWDGENGADVEDEVMRSQDAKKGKNTARARAGEFIKGVLSGGPKLSAEVFEAAEKAGHSEKTLRRAMEDVQVAYYKEKGKMDGQWWLTLPAQTVTERRAPLN